MDKELEIKLRKAVLTHYNTIRYGIATDEKITDKPAIKGHDATLHQIREESGLPLMTICRLCGLPMYLTNPHSAICELSKFDRKALEALDVDDGWVDSYTNLVDACNIKGVISQYDHDDEHDTDNNTETETENCAKIPLFEDSRKRRCTDRIVEMLYSVFPGLDEKCRLLILISHFTQKSNVVYSRMINAVCSSDTISYSVYDDVTEWLHDWLLQSGSACGYDAVYNKLDEFELTAKQYKYPTIRETLAMCLHTYALTKVYNCNEIADSVCDMLFNMSLPEASSPNVKNAKSLKRLSVAFNDVVNKVSRYDMSADLEPLCTALKSHNIDLHKSTKYMNIVVDGRAKFIVSDQTLFFNEGFDPVYVNLNRSDIYVNPRFYEFVKIVYPNPLTLMSLIAGYAILHDYPYVLDIDSKASFAEHPVCAGIYAMHALGALVTAEQEIVSDICEDNRKARKAVKKARKAILPAWRLYL